MYSSPNSSPRVFSPSCLSPAASSESSWDEEEDDLERRVSETVPLSSSPLSSPGYAAITPPRAGSDTFSPITHTPPKGSIYASDVVSDSDAVYGDLKTPLTDSDPPHQLGEILSRIFSQHQSTDVAHTIDPTSPSVNISSIEKLSRSPDYSASSSGYDASDSCSSDSCCTVTRSCSLTGFDYTKAAGARTESKPETMGVSESGTRQPFETPNNSRVLASSTFLDAPKKVQHTIRIFTSTSSQISVESASDSISRPDTSRSSVNENKPSAYNEDPFVVGNQTLEACSPPAKKQKILGPRSLSGVTGANLKDKAIFTTNLAPDRFAMRRASLRKAASLASEPSQQDENDISGLSAVKNDTQPISAAPSAPTHSGDTRDPTDDLSAIKTEPNTPMISACSSRTTPQHAQRQLTPLPHPLPIIAPPSFISIPRAPASPEEIAEIRLKIMLAKEQDERFDDGLDTHVARAIIAAEHEVANSDSSCDDSDEDMTDTEKELWRGLPEPDMEMVKGFSKPNSEKDELPFLCIEDDFRLEIITWMLDTVPPGFPAKPQLCRELRLELAECIDTRWHAIQLFLRYFVRIGGSPPCSPSVPKIGSSMMASSQIIDSEDERAYFLWDIAVACIALAVKFHRDVLYPLNPVFADEFVLIAPHSLTYDDFETAQRHILSTFEFSMGSVTPGVYMEELWNALPSLRHLLDTKQLWDKAKRLAWEVISDAVFELEHIRYRTSTLTGCALVRGLIDTLIIQKKERAKSKPSIGSRRDARCNCAKISRSATRAVTPVELDIMDVLKVNEMEWNACKDWLIQLSEQN